MFKKLNKRGLGLNVLFVLMLVMFAFVGTGECTLTATVGDQNSSGKHRIEVSTDGTNGTVTFQNDTAILFPYQSGTTNDTLTAADSGRTYVTSSGTVSAVIINLPAATPGLNFPFITGTTHSLYVNPSGVETINYASLAAGDSIYNSSAAKGDSITLFCVIAGQWEADIHNGTWATGGGIEF